MNRTQPSGNTQTMDNRLPAPMGLYIDRQQPISMTFEGQTHQGFCGDSIASALAADGRRRAIALHPLLPLGLVLVLPGLLAVVVIEVEGLERRYSTLSSHRNRPAGGSQSISKCAREIGPTVSQFLNVHGKFSVSVLIGYLTVLDN